MSCQSKLLPRSFVGRDIDHAVIGNFMKKKHPVLSQCIGKTDTYSIYCTTANFEKLLGTIASDDTIIRMKAYFATYCTMSGAVAGIPVSYRDTTTLIFVPVNDSEQDVGKYYIIHPVDSSIVELTKDLADTMVTYFQQNRVPLLQEVAYSCRKDFIESRAVWYDIRNLNNPVDGFLGELQCQGAAGVAFHFGAYPVTEMYEAGTAKPVGLQLTLIMLPVQTCTFDGEDYLYYFDIEDTPGFGQRHKNPNPGGGNTVNPCPPATGCTPSVGGQP
ncbi:MAG: hypothetical protein J0H74_15915 [Chitinophagaceae bacterium]|nr:hypothetical protein [Chitinophagaceae bacterium]